jgi:hypothetical protein
MDWSTWVQGVSGGLIDKWGSAQFVQPYEVQKLQMQALGQLGYFNEGQAGLVANRNGLQISPGLLMIGGIVLLVVMMKD